MDAVATIEPAAAGLDGGPGGGEAVDDAVEVDGHGAPVGLRVEVVAHPAPGGHAGIEVCDVERTERIDSGRDCSGARRGVGHVGSDETASEIVRECAAPRHVDVGDDDAGTPGRQVPGHTLADAVAAAGDEGDLAVDVDAMGCPIVGERSEVQPAAGAGSGWACTTLRCWIGRVMAT